MITNPLSFHISPQWKQTSTNSSTTKPQKLTLKHLYKSKSLDTCHTQPVVNLHNNDNKNTNLLHLNQTPVNIKDSFLNSNLRCITINLDTGENHDQKIKTVKDLNEILNDLLTYRNKLNNTHGSIHIQAYSSHTKRCHCNHDRSTEICKQISQFENELFQNDFIEYIFKIKSIANKNIILK